MVQQLKLETIVTIPPDYVLIKRSEYEDLTKNYEEGMWWTLDEVLDRAAVSRTWFTENFLNHPLYRRAIDVDNGGFVKFPNKKNNKYLFHATKTKEFLETKFKNVLREDNGR